MRAVISFALVMLAIAVAVPHLYKGWLEASGARASATAASQAAAVAIPAAPIAPSAGYRSLTLSRQDDGHFHTEAILDGRRMSFLVDTGASVIALRARDAALLGIFPAPRDFTARVSTANGTVMAAPVEIRRVDVGSLSVYNVAALVLPDTALSQNLLGMSFLGRVRFEHRNGRLYLEQ